MSVIRRIKVRTKQRHSVYRQRPFDPVEFTALLKRVYVPLFARMLKSELASMRRLSA